MKKVKIMCTATILLGGILLGGTSVLAVESDGEITLKAGSIGPGGPDIELEEVTDFNFGEKEISGSKQTYLLETGSTKTKITDLRGDGAGWDLTASVTEFQNGGKTLTGAALTLTEGALTSPGISPAPTATRTTLNTAAASVITAGVGTGMGTWEQDYTGAELEIPGGSFAGTYSAKLEWTLTAAPVTTP